MTLVMGSHKRPQTASIPWTGSPPVSGAFIVDNGTDGESFFIKPTPPRKASTGPGMKWLTRRHRESMSRPRTAATDTKTSNPSPAVDERSPGNCCLCTFVRSELDSFDMRRKKKVALSIAKGSGGLTSVVSVRKASPAVIQSLFANDIRSSSSLIARLRSVDITLMRKTFRSLMRSNGCITKPDFITLVRKMIPKQQVCIKDINTLFDSFDASHGGEVDYVRFFSNFSRQLGNPDPRGQLSEVWEVMRQEKMGSGAVTLFELSAILKQLHPACIAEGVHERIVKSLMQSPGLPLFERGECTFDDLQYAVESSSYLTSLFLSPHSVPIVATLRSELHAEIAERTQKGSHQK
eukprot:TRINITY_DN18771_c0_g1_i1.p1 TRINITY_DN18771_c0_g1~~TRINITY_DN18771_c0_g1_i1.p1  ORF type:complete len:350 (+),score=59.76 TRINITY_DN18771_c0_g1_i1:77-1126(+)